MVTANELRIGNILFSRSDSSYGEKGVFKIVSIGYSLINEWKDMGASGGHGYDQVDPIPLTPAILEKCGFVAYESDYLPYGHPSGEELVKGGDQLFFYGNSGPIGVPLLYLHQLQNVFFELTGEELNVRL